jgi:hypothetical protein
MRTTVSKKDKSSAPKRRLVDMEVDELSAVDRGANRHKFLVVKRSEGMQTNKTDAPSLVLSVGMKKTAQENLAGSLARLLTFVKKVQGSSPSDRFEGLAEAYTGELGALAKAVASQEQPSGAGDLPDLAMPSSVRDAILDACAKAADAVSSLADTVATAAEAEGVEALPEDLAKAYVAAGAAIEAVLATAQTLKSAPAEAPVEAPVAAPAEATVSVVTEVSAETSVEQPAALEKAARMERFHTSLSFLAKQVEQQMEALVTAPVSTAGTNEAVTFEAAQAAETATARPGYAVANKAATLPATPSVDPAIFSRVAELEQLTKSQARELAELRKARGTSHQIPVEGDTGRRVADAAVHWDLDMNKPVSRSTVKKAVSFFDEDKV